MDFKDGVNLQSHSDDSFNPRDGETEIQDAGDFRGEPELSALQTELDRLRAEVARLSETATARQPDHSPRFISTLPGESGDGPPQDGLSFEARLHAARTAGNTVEAIRIKQEAARDGIVLI